MGEEWTAGRLEDWLKDKGPTTRLVAGFGPRGEETGAVTFVVRIFDGNSEVGTGHALTLDLALDAAIGSYGKPGNVTVKR